MDMCNNFPNIKIVEGNAFALLLPLKKRTFESCEPIDEDIDCTQLTDVVFKFGGVEYQVELGADGVRVVMPATLAKGTYGIVLTATYYGSSIRAAYESAVSIVAYNSQSDAQQYLPGSPIVLNGAYIIGGAMTDTELEALKEEYRAKIEEAEQAKEEAEEAKQEYIEKAEMLEDVAKETTSQEIKELIINEGIEHAHEYAEEIHEIIGDWTI